MDHSEIIASFATDKKCCETQHCIHKETIACNKDENTPLDDRYCIRCISGIFHESLEKTNRERVEKRSKVSEGHQFLATGFADGDLYQYEYVNTGETFFYRQAPSSEETIHETGLKWFETRGTYSVLGGTKSQAPLCTKGNEFNGLVHSELKQKTLDDFLIKKT
jgi:hypothetical protein